MSKDNGGSAFPVTNGMGDCTTGMTLRDYFADGALKSGLCPCNSYDFEAIAKWANQVADAMLKERVK